MVDHSLAAARWKMAACKSWLVLAFPGVTLRTPLPAMGSSNGRIAGGFFRSFFSRLRRNQLLCDYTEQSERKGADNATNGTAVFDCSVPPMVAVPVGAVFSSCGSASKGR